MTAHVSEELTALVDGELTPADQARVEEHLAGCATCAAERTLLLGALGRLGAVEPIEPSADLRRKVLNALDAEPQGARSWFQSIFTARFLVPAVAAGGAALALAFAVARPVPEGGMDDLEVAERLDLLQDLDVVEAAPVGVSPADLVVVAQLDVLLEVGE